MTANLKNSLVDGFSLVEVTVAIGIFAFVVVGVLGLLPVGMRMRAESAAETRGILIAEELFAAVRAAQNLNSVVTRVGPGYPNPDYRTNTIANGSELILGYPSGTTVPYWYYFKDPRGAWLNRGGGNSEIIESSTNSIDLLARLSATRVNGDLFRVTVEVRSPASAPLDETNRPPVRFSTLIRSR